MKNGSRRISQLSQLGELIKTQEPENSAENKGQVTASLPEETAEKPAPVIYLGYSSIDEAGVSPS